MTIHYTPRVFLRQVPNGLLQVYFAKRNQLQEIQWDRLAETDVEPIHQALLELPEADRREIGGHFGLRQVFQLQVIERQSRIRQGDLRLVPRRRLEIREGLVMVFLKQGDPPALATVDCAAQCLAAHEVGGDYFLTG